MFFIVYHAFILASSIFSIICSYFALHPYILSLLLVAFPRLGQGQSQNTAVITESTLTSRTTSKVMDDSITVHSQWCSPLHISLSESHVTLHFRGNGHGVEGTEFTPWPISIWFRPERIGTTITLFQVVMPIRSTKLPLSNMST